MAAYEYKGCVFAIITRSELGRTTVDFMTEALKEAKENAPTGCFSDIARYLVTTTFKTIPQPDIRYNAFITAMTHLGLDMFGALNRAARKALKKSKAQNNDAYWKGVCDGLLAAEQMTRSPYTFRDDLAGAMRKGREELTEIQKEMRKDARHTVQPE